MVRKVRLGARSGGVRFRRVVPVRSAAVRRRCDRQPRVGGRAGARRRARRRRRRRRSSRRCRRSSSTAAPIPSWVSGDDEDVHSFVERQLVERDRRCRPAPPHRPLAQRAGVGRPAAVPAPPHSAAAARQLRATIAALADQAEQAGDALMPSYTHMRRAQPVLVSHFLLSHAARAAPRSRSAGGGARGSRRAARSGPARSPAPATRSTRSRSPSRSASAASSPTAWTRRPIATSPRPSFTPCRCRWCT